MLGGLFANADAWLQATEPEDFVLRRDCLTVLQLFQQVGHCWRYAAMGGILGLDWCQVESYLRLIQQMPKPAEVEQLRHIERGILSVFHKKD